MNTLTKNRTRISPAVNVSGFRDNSRVATILLILVVASADLYLFIQSRETVATINTANTTVTMLPAPLTKTMPTQ